MIWLGLYPLLQLATLVLIPHLGAIPAPIRTLLISTLLVGLMTYSVTPALRHLLHPWLQ